MTISIKEYDAGRRERHRLMAKILRQLSPDLAELFQRSGEPPVSDETKSMCGQVIEVLENKGK